MPAKRRNPVARCALMRKGGVHQRAKSSRRFKDKQALKRELARSYNDNGGRSPRFFWPLFSQSCGA